MSAESKDGTGGAEGSVQIKEAYGLGGVRDSENLAESVA